MNPGDLLLVAGDLARFVRHNPSGNTITVIFDGEQGESVVSSRHCKTRNLAAIQEAKRLLSMAENGNETLSMQFFLARKAHEVLAVFAE